MISDTLKAPLPEWLVPGIIAALGAALLGFAVRVVVQQLAALEDMVSTVGVVVEDARLARADRPQNSDPAMQVAYRAHDGREYRLVAQHYGHHPEFPRGSPVPVIYYREHPDQGRVDTFRELWLAPLVLGAGGLLLILVGGTGAWWARKEALARERAPDPFVDALRRPR